MTKIKIEDVINEDKYFNFEKIDAVIMQTLFDNIEKKDKLSYDQLIYIIHLYRAKWMQSNNGLQPLGMEKENARK